MLSLRDIYHENYYNEDGTINPKCRLFEGISEENKNKYLTQFKKFNQIQYVTKNKK